MPKHVGQM